MLYAPSDANIKLAAYAKSSLFLGTYRFKKEASNA